MCVYLQLCVCVCVVPCSFTTFTPDFDGGARKVSCEPECMNSVYESCSVPRERRSPRKKSGKLGQTRWNPWNYTAHCWKKVGVKIDYSHGGDLKDIHPVPLSSWAGKPMPRGVKEKTPFLQQLSDSWLYRSTFACMSRKVTVLTKNRGIKKTFILLLS